MRILLTANASYVPPRGGATRSNLLWLAHLARSGHTCQIIAAALPETAAKRVQLSDEASDWQTVSQTGGVRNLRRANLEIYEVADRNHQSPILRQQIHKFQPDWVLVSSEDLGHGLLHEAHHSAPGRVVYLAHTPQFFPFGPASWNPDAYATDLVTRSRGVIAIGHHVARYIRQHAGCEATVIHPPIYGSGPFPNLASFDTGLVTMVNPCALKGIAIFLALADRFPEHAFGVLPGWGTTSSDRAELTARANITILPNCRNIADFLGRSRILLMPSIWYEGFGLTVMEAMLHGIPVISSDTGGLVEAKLGTPFVAPVPAIERFEPVFDEHALPKPVIGPLDLEPWTKSLNALLIDRTLYEQVSTASREAALRFVDSLDARRMQTYLESLTPGEAVAAPPSLADLSPDKRALLLQKIRSRRAVPAEPR